MTGDALPDTISCLGFLRFGFDDRHSCVYLAYNEAIPTLAAGPWWELPTNLTQLPIAMPEAKAISPIFRARDSITACLGAQLRSAAFTCAVSAVIRKVVTKTVFIFEPLSSWHRLHIYCGRCPLSVNATQAALEQFPLTRFKYW